MGLQKGDSIKCHDKEDAAELAEELGMEGYDWDFCYSMDGEKGIWILIYDVPEGEVKT